MQPEQLQHAGEPLAWWLIGVVIFVGIAITGFFLKDGLKQLREAFSQVKEELNAVSKTLQEILQFIATQSEKNQGVTKEISQIWDDLEKQWSDIDDLKNKVKDIQKEQEYCPIAKEKK